ncbi:MAG: ACP S-malonyltransferase [Clostridia bacterium]|nr:ACP S-malonyltransferase [Clostridia bacterium]
MGRIAFIFAGQGDQFPGMGQDLANTYPIASAVFARLDAIRPGTSAQCFSGTAEELKITKNTQPCLFAYELAAASVLKEHGIVPECTAGFSLGEVAAVTFAGMVDEGTGFNLVCRRGELMQQAAEAADTAMAAVVKLTDEKVEEICSGFTHMYPVNYNCPGQVSVAGAAEEMDAFAAAVKAAGGRALPLKVNGAFHSPYMVSASESFEKVLESVDFAAPAIPVYSDVTAEPYGENITELLAKQIASPVRFAKIVQNMIDAGIDTFIEIGPGKTISGLVGRISSDVKVYTTADMNKILAEAAVC